MGGHYIGKRSAEANAHYIGLPYAAGLPYSGLPYAAGPLALASAGAVAHVPVVKSVEETPAEVSQEVTAHALPVAVGYHGLGYHGLGYHGLGSGHYIGKREADPLVLAGSTKILTPSTPLIHNAPVLPTIAHPVAYHGLGEYAGLGGYAGLGYGHYIGKRSAEADAQYLGLPCAAGLPYAGLPYAAGPLALASAGAVAHVPVVKSVEETPAEVSQEVTAHALPVAVGYHGLGYHGLGYNGLGYGHIVG